MIFFPTQWIFPCNMFSSWAIVTGALHNVDELGLCNFLIAWTIGLGWGGINAVYRFGKVK